MLTRDEFRFILDRYPGNMLGEFKNVVDQREIKDCFANGSNFILISLRSQNCLCLYPMSATEQAKLIPSSLANLKLTIPSWATCRLLYVILFSTMCMACCGTNNSKDTSRDGA